MWDDYEGYIADPATKPSEDHVRSADQRSWVLPTPDPEGDFDVEDPDAPAAPAAKRAKHRLRFQGHWTKTLPYLAFVLGMGVALTSTTRREVAEGTFACPSEDGCVVHRPHRKESPRPSRAGGKEPPRPEWSLWLIK